MPERSEREDRARAIHLRRGERRDAVQKDALEAEKARQQQPGHVSSDN